MLEFVTSDSFKGGALILVTAEIENPFRAECMEGTTKNEHELVILKAKEEPGGSGRRSCTDESGSKVEFS